MPVMFNPATGKTVSVQDWAVNMWLAQGLKLVSDPAPSSVTAPPVVNDERAKREAKRATQQWDNNPAVKAIQERVFNIYVDTGRWDTAEQKALHDQAELVRKTANPVYTGSPNGPATQAEADKVYPKDTTPGLNFLEGGADSAIDPTKWAGYAKAGIGVFFLVFLMSMFRR